MGGMDWLLEIVLIVLLGLTLMHAVRLERGLSALRHERTALGEAVAGFDNSTRQAEAGLDKLHSMTQETALQLARKLEGAAVLKDDLAFLVERGEHLADRLERLVRSGRAIEPNHTLELEPALVPADPVQADYGQPRPRSKAERDLLQALRVAR
jgi:Domain of unknown function (DUF6468)